MKKYILAIDQGTTSSRAIIFDGNRKPLAQAQQEFTQYFPQPGWVEHNPQEIWQSVIATSRQAIVHAGLNAHDIVAIGITNQRETTVVWNKDTGEFLCNAVVWQDRRTAHFCQKLRDQGVEKTVQSRTGLLLDPYFSGSKLAWICSNIPQAKQLAQAGKLAFGTMDTYLIWRFTNGKSFVTDATNASRTSLYNIHSASWDVDMLNVFGIPHHAKETLLPKVYDCAADFGITDPQWLGAAIPICGVAGDQQAASIGNACFRQGMVKSTYGTGCFALLNTGSYAVSSCHRLLTTIAYQLDNHTCYALEGSIFMAGATVQWLRDKLGIIAHANECDNLAQAADDSQQVYLIPAFVGMGAPHWNPHAQAAMFGLTRATGKCEIVKAALESVCFQTNDLLGTMQADWHNYVHGHTDNTTSEKKVSNTGKLIEVIRVDGGMVASNWTMQRLADLLDLPVDRPHYLETTALGAAWLAGHYVGVWPGMAEFAKTWSLEKRFMPKMHDEQRDTLRHGWQDALNRTL